MAKSRHFYIRRIHRYLGVILGIQFLFWTVSGLYFSWSDIDEIHGDFQHKQPPLLTASFNYVSPSVAISKLPLKADSIKQLQVINILQKPFYNISYYSGKNLHNILADAVSGNVRDNINKDEAIKIAAESFAGSPEIKEIEYVTAVGKHDEYREKPLPAWKVTFNHPTNTNVYVAAATGKVETFRNDRWRIFDFLWMFHTMDYEGRDDINNWVLRAFSVFGLVTVLSGFLLFFVSTRWYRRKIMGNRQVKRDKRQETRGNRQVKRDK